MTSSTKLTLALEQLEAELRCQTLWQAEAPAENALQSTQPFAIDSLEPHEWLQWLFIPGMRRLIESEAELPGGFTMLPYFEEVWKEQPQYRRILDRLRDIEKVCQ